MDLFGHTGTFLESEDRERMLDVLAFQKTFQSKEADERRLHRFLILGTENSVYLSKQKDCVRRDVDSIHRLISRGCGRDVVEIIRNASVTFRNCRQNSTLYALAVCARSKDLHTKEAAYSALPQVSTSPTDLLTFIMFCEMLSEGTGWGRAHRRAVCAWYNSFRGTPMEFASGITKCLPVGQWTHKDVFRLTHVKPDTQHIMLIVRYVTKGLAAAKSLACPIDQDERRQWNETIGYLEGVEQARQSTDCDETVMLINKHRLEPHQLSARMLKLDPVWQALLNNIPLELMIQNIHKIQDTPAESAVLQRLEIADELQRAKMHPYKILSAIKEVTKKATDKPNIVRSLKRAYELCLKNVKPTTKRYYLAVHVGKNTELKHTELLTVHETMAVMAMIIARVTHADSEVVVYTSDSCNMKMDISESETLCEVQRNLSTIHRMGIPGKGVDTNSFHCSRIIRAIQERRNAFDAIVILTYSPCKERQHSVKRDVHSYTESKMVDDVRLVIVSMTDTNVSILDPRDAFMLDMIGFGIDAPEVIMSFVEGRAPITTPGRDTCT